ncbi:MAG: hypothetical protein CMJ52_07195 [Planctomycetaceae bacterium]|nr:hypothetical protein [Planctomycetaceae bacterium]
MLDRPATPQEFVPSSFVARDADRVMMADPRRTRRRSRIERRGRDRCRATSSECLVSSNWGCGSKSSR